MIEMGCFEELNLFAPDGGPSADVIEEIPPQPIKRSFFSRVFRRRVSKLLIRNSYSIMYFIFVIIK